MSPGIPSTWSSAVLVILNLPQGQKAHFHATSGFFLTCDQQVSFFLESENYRISLFWGGSIFAEEISPARAKHVREQSSLRVNFLV